MKKGREHIVRLSQQAIALAHVERNSSRGAYNAAHYLTQRTRMMQWWADWLDHQRDLAELLG